MTSEAYERNFLGMASAIDTAMKQNSELRTVVEESQRQLQDLIQRITILENQVQALRAQR